MAKPRCVPFEQVREMMLSFPDIEEARRTGRRDSASKASLWHACARKTCSCHYRGYPTILIRLSQVRDGELRELIEQSWRWLTPAKLLASFDAGVERAPASSGAKSSAGKRR